MTAGGALRADAGGASAVMSIGEVLAHLRVEFPDVTISKLRFLEAEGLVEPRRTPSGYRKYSWPDVARLRFVLTVQRDHYFPLRVIRDHLAALDRGENPPPLTAVRPHAAPAAERSQPGLTVERSPSAPAAHRSPQGPTGQRSAQALAGGRPRPALVRVGEEPGDTPGAEVRLTRQELAERTGAGAETLRDLEQHGVLTPRAGGWYDADALAVVEVAVALADYGVQGRHLRAYRTAADREVGLFAQLVAPLVRQPDPAGRVRAAETVRELASLSARLHAALVRAGLRETLGG